MSIKEDGFKASETFAVSRHSPPMPRFGQNTAPAAMLLSLECKLTITANRAGSQGHV